MVGDTNNYEVYQEEKKKYSLNVIWERFNLCSVSASLVSQGQKEWEKEKELKLNKNFAVKQVRNISYELI